MKYVLIVAIVIVVVIAALMTALFVMIKPNKKRDTSYFKDKLYAHRGLHDDEIPENSLWAFREAAKAGYGVELDVQMTKDGQLVVFHDGTLNRMCGVDGKLSKFTYEELQQFRLKDTEEKIPLFADVLEALDGVDLICELKSDNGMRNYAFCEKVYDMLMTYKGQFCIESFSPYIVGWFKRKHSEIIRGQLSENFDKSMGLNPIHFCMSHLLVNAISRPDFVAYNHLYTNTFGFRLVKKIYRPLLVAWTAKGIEEQEKAWKEFDAVIFEKNKRK